MTEQEARSFAISVPVGGWNARDPLKPFDPRTQTGMPETDAIRLVNVFPDTADVAIRNGFRVHATGLGTGAVGTLAEYAGRDGTRKLIAAANNRLYDASTYNAAATSLATGFTTNRWQYVNFKNVLILVNGQDQPQQYNGTAVSAANYTGIANDDTLANVSVYRGRLYFVAANSTSIWYGGAGSITGALTELDVSDVLRNGGFIQFAGSLSRDTGNGIQDLFVIVTNTGEVLVYQGSFPGGSDWSLAGRYYLPAPLGRRGCVNIGSDLIIISQAGVIPMSVILQGEDPDSEQSKVTRKINRAFLDAAKTYGANFGWQACVYPRGSMAVINVPIAADTQAEQYVMNTFTGAWCKFTGMNAVCWATFNDKLYFGGTDGRVFEADIGANDNGANINTEIKIAFNYYGDTQRQKQFLMARPQFNGDTAIQAALAMDVDYKDQALTDSISTLGSTGSTWDLADWDTSDWDGANVVSENWYSISGIGRCGALRIRGSYNNVSWRLSAIDVMFKVGNTL